MRPHHIAKRLIARHGERTARRKAAERVRTHRHRLTLAAAPDIAHRFARLALWQVIAKAIGSCPDCHGTGELPTWDDIERPATCPCQSF